MASKDCIPIMHPGIKTKPEINALSQMTENELSKVKDFTLENDYGKIEYVEPVDLRHVNLKEDV